MNKIGILFFALSTMGIGTLSAQTADSTQTSPWTKEGFLTFLMKENAMFLVVEEKGRILGYCGLLTVLDEGDVTNVAVRRDRQREGIGNFLMESMIRLAEERGITMIHLEVRAGNETAIRLYERQGFVRDGLRKAYYTDPTEDAVLMTRTAS